MNPSKPREYEIKRAHERLTELLDKEIAYTALLKEAEALASTLAHIRTGGEGGRKAKDAQGALDYRRALATEAIARFDAWKERNK